MSVAEHPTQVNDLVLPAQPATALVELTGIVSDKGKFYACMTDGRRHWIIKCEVKHFQDFDVFQEHVADSRGIWINHPSQHRVTARIRALAWNKAVQTALDRGREK